MLRFTGCRQPKNVSTVVHFVVTSHHQPEATSSVHRFHKKNTCTRIICACEKFKSTFEQLKERQSSSLGIWISCEKIRSSTELISTSTTFGLLFCLTTADMQEMDCPIASKSNWRRLKNPLKTKKICAVRHTRTEDLIRWDRRGKRTKKVKRNRHLSKLKTSRSKNKRQMHFACEESTSTEKKQKTKKCSKHWSAVHRFQCKFN